MTIHFLAAVEFDATRSLPDLAKQLTKVLQIQLCKEVSGRFDEVPAYVGSDGDLDIILFGPSIEQEERECILKVTYTTSLSKKLAQEAVTPILRPTFCSEEPDCTGYVRCSQQLVAALVELGFSDCRPVR